MDEDLLVQKHPTLYHMAESGTWPSILEHGLLSSEALLDLLGASDEERTLILKSHRKKQISFRGVVIRDQKPMNHNLSKCLPENISPAGWFHFLNRKVFFWTSEERLNRFRKAYEMKRQLIIEIPTKNILNAYRGKIKLCHINSGATRMPNHFRDFDIFSSISLFEYSPRKKPVELTVDCAVTNIEQLASKVYEVGGGKNEIPLY